MRTTFGLIFAGLVAVSAPLSAQTTIGADSSWGFPLIFGHNQVWGQTFTAPTDNVLTDFSFWLSADSTGWTVPVNPYVYAWRHPSNLGGLFGTTVGDPLWVGASTYVTHTALTQYQFCTCGTSLVPGSTYVMLLHAVGAENNVYIESSYEPFFGPPSAENQYLDGKRTRDGESWLWPGDTYYWAMDDEDLRFEANFVSASVPEPSTYLLMLTGIMGLGLVAWRWRELEA